jgi:acetyl-CoA acetyltransferase
VREVAVVGAGMIPFAKYKEKSVVELGSEAIRKALKDAGVPKDKIEHAYCGTVYSGMLSGQKIYKEVGIDSIPIFNVENACSSGATAFHLAYEAIATGVIDTAIVLGVEKLTGFGGGTIPLDNTDVDVRQGLTMPGLYAMRAMRYMEDYGCSKETLAKVTVKSHENASLNPYAQLRNKVTVEEVLNSRPISDPLTLLQCCPTGDGAAAIVLTSMKESKKYTKNPVKILASELTSGKYTNGYRDMTIPEITVRGAKLAYELAGVGPKDIDLAEVHDAFTIAEMLYYEAFQFCERGGAIRLIEDGETKINGSIPVNPSGGLLSKGHPLGATGASQIVEVYNQLRGRAGEHQVNNPKIGLTHCTGGGISGFDHGACSIHIFGR